LIRVGGAYAFLVAYAASLGGKKTVFIILLESSQHPLFWDKTWHYGSFGRVVRCRWPFFSSPPLENNIGHSVLLLISNCCYWSFYKFSIYFQFHHSILICDIFFFQFYHSIPIDFSFQFHPSIKNLLLFFISILISILLIVFFC